MLTVVEHEPHAAPPSNHTLSRRQFIERTGGVTGGAIVFGLAGGAGVLAETPATTAFAALPATAPSPLTSDELTTLRAMLARLFPADELGPGAIEAGVDVYVRQALAGAYAIFLPLYQQNLAVIDQAAKTMGATSFAGLTAQQQDSLLQQVEAGKAPVGKTGATPVEVAQFFQLLLAHMREGMFGDPMYGGNKDFAGWDLIGYPGIKLVWTAQDQKIGAKVPFEHRSAGEYGGDPYHGPIPEK
jgi:gluconate 2-dehydrogenase gamma chain